MVINFSKIADEILSLPELCVPVGINLKTANPVCIDLKESPHTLVAGITGFGKSSLVNVIFVSVRMRSKDIRLIYLNPLSINSKKLFPASVEEFGVEEINKQLSLEVKRMQSLYDSNSDYTVLVIDECSIVCEDRDNTLAIEAIAKTGRHSNYCLFMLTQFPTLQSFGGSSLIKQNLHNHVVFRCGDSVRATHSVLATDIEADKLYKRGECFVRTPNILAKYGGPLHCQAFYLPQKDICKYISEESGSQESGVRELEGKENGCLTRDELNRILAFLKENKSISGKDVRRILCCQNDQARRIIAFLIEREIIIQAESKTGKCRLSDKMDLDLNLDLSRILENPGKEEVDMDLSSKSNVIDIQRYFTTP